MLRTRRSLARTAASVAVVAVAAVLLAACGDTGSDRDAASSTAAPSSTSLPSASSPPGDGGTATSPPATDQPPVAGVASEFVGLTKEEAIALAESQGRPWRIAREDEQSFPLTLDYSENRVNFEIDDGKVTVATFG